MVLIIGWQILKVAVEASVCVFVYLPAAYRRADVWTLCLETPGT